MCECRIEKNVLNYFIEISLVGSFNLCKQIILSIHDQLYLSYNFDSFACAASTHNMHTMRCLVHHISATLLPSYYTYLLLTVMMLEFINGDKQQLFRYQMTSAPNSGNKEATVDSASPLFLGKQTGTFCNDG